MSKRYTDIMKWEQPWFRKLSPDQKLLFMYLCDKADKAGVWEIDEEVFALFTGVKTPIADLVEGIKGLVPLGGDKLRLTKFIEFQYGKLSETCKPHAKVFQALEKHGLSYDSEDSPNRVSDTLSHRVCHTLEEEEEEEDKEEDKDKGMGKGALLTNAVSYWNAKLGGILKVVRDKTPKRATHLSARCGTDDPHAKFVEVVNIIRKSPFLLGQNDRNWCATFDWVLKPDNWAKVREGQYLQNKNEKTLGDDDHAKGF